MYPSFSSLFSLKNVGRAVSWAGGLAGGLYVQTTQSTMTTVKYSMYRLDPSPSLTIIFWHGTGGAGSPGRVPIFFAGLEGGGAWGQSIAIVMEGIPQVHNKVEIDEKTWKRDDDKSVGATATERYVYLVLTYFSTYCYRLTHD